MRDQSRTASVSDPGREWRVYAVGLSAGAGMIHWIVAPEHFAHWWGYGWFFAAVGALQVTYAVLLALSEPTRRVVFIGLVGNGLIVLLYVITRTLGIPFVGPCAGEIEPVGLVDVISKTTELGLMVSLAQILRTKRDGGPALTLPRVAQRKSVRKDRDE